MKDFGHYGDIYVFALSSITITVFWPWNKNRNTWTCRSKPEACYWSGASMVTRPHSERHANPRSALSTGNVLLGVSAGLSCECRAAGHHAVWIAGVLSGYDATKMEEYSKVFVPFVWSKTISCLINLFCFCFLRLHVYLVDVEMTQIYQLKMSFIRGFHDKPYRVISDLQGYFKSALVFRARRVSQKLFLDTVPDGYPLSECCCKQVQGPPCLSLKYPRTVTEREILRCSYFNTKRSLITWTAISIQNAHIFLELLSMYNILAVSYSGCFHLFTKIMWKVGYSFREQNLFCSKLFGGGFST